MQVNTNLIQTYLYSTQNNKKHVESVLFDELYQALPSLQEIINYLIPFFHA